MLDELRVLSKWSGNGGDDIIVPDLHRYILHGLHVRGNVARIGGFDGHNITDALPCLSHRYCAIGGPSSQK